MVNNQWLDWLASELACLWNACLWNEEHLNSVLALEGEKKKSDSAIKYLRNWNPNKQSREVV